MGLLDPPSYSRAAADTRFTRGLGARFGFLGDSLTAGAVAGTTRGWAWPYGLSLVSGGVVKPVIIDGFPGQRSDQIAPLVTDIITAGVQTCVVAFGTNDILQGVQGILSSVVKANLKTVVGKLLAAGIQPVLATLPPNNGSGTYKSAIASLNAWIKRYAGVNRLPVIDFYAALVDPSNTNYVAALNSDGTHPNAAGYLVMAQTAWTALQPLIFAAAPTLTQANSDPINLLTANTCFLTDADANGIPDGWTTYGGTSGYTHSIVTGDTTITGNWAQIACAASGSDRVLEFNVTGAAVVPGNTILVAGRVSTTAYTSGTGATVKVTFTGGGASAYPVYQFKVVATGPFYQELVIPAGTTALLFDFVAGAGTGTYRLAQPTIHDLTALGLTSL